jgi:hypothetical protein
MTGRQLKRIMVGLGWEREMLADRLGIQPSSVQRWVSGVYTIPEHVADWLRDLIDAQRAEDMGRYNRLLAALPNGWQGKPNVRNPTGADA